MNIDEASERIAEHHIRLDQIEREWKHQQNRQEFKLNAIMIGMGCCIIIAFLFGVMI